MSKVTNSLLHRIQVRQAGKKDGQLSIPAKTDSHISPFETELLERGAEHLSQTEKSFADRINKSIATREEAITTFDLRVTEYEEVQSKLARHWAGRDIDQKISRRTYLTLLFIIGLGEFVLNSVVFNVFGESPLFTGLASLAVAFSLPILAHWSGIIIKQGFLPISRTIVVLGSLAAVFFGLHGITTARSEYMTALTEMVDIGSTGDAFFYLNAMIFMAALAMSFFVHDQDAILENLTRSAESLTCDMDRLDQRIDTLGGQIDALRCRKQAEMGQINATIQQLLQMYRKSNLYKRSADDRPEVFRQMPEPIEPKQFQEIQKQTGHKLLDAIRDRRKMAARAVSERQFRDDLPALSEGRKTRTQTDDAMPSTPSLGKKRGLIAHAS